MNIRSAQYLLAGLSQVEGWLSPTTAYVITELVEQQSIDGIQGDLAEIGVHHGKSFLAFANSVASGEKLFAIDIFEDQQKNVDRSGSGSRQTFLENVAAYAPGSPIEVIQESSLDLSGLGWPRAHANSIRFFSIDGSHTREATLNDLRIAERTTKAGAIVAVDDVLAPQWLGVVSGVFDYLSSGGKLIPFALLPNKMLLANDGKLATRWKEFLRSRYDRSITKRDVKFLGHSVDIVDEDPALLGELRTERPTLFEVNLAQGGNSASFTDKHWAGPEPWGQWTAALQASLSFPIGVAHHVGVVVLLRALLTARTPKQLVWIDVNGCRIGGIEFDLAHGSGFQTLSAAIPANCIGASGKVVLSINTDRLQTPKELGINEDTRQLGVGVERVLIREFPPALREPAAHAGR